MKDETRQRLETLAEDQGVPVEKVTELFETYQEEYESKYEGRDADRGVIETAALGRVGTELNNFGEIPVEGTPALTLGAEFRPREYFFTEGDAILGAAIINPDDDQAGLATIVIDTADGIDIDHAIDVFEPLTTARLHVSRRTVGTRDGEPSVRKYNKPCYVCETSGNSKLEIVNPDEVPDSDPINELPVDDDGKRELLNESFFGPDETVEIHNIPDNHATTDDRGFPAAFGVDMKRFRGRVIDTYVKEEGDPFSFGSVVMVDDSILVDEDVPPELVTDKQRTPGLNVNLAPPYNRYGKNSVLDLYGYVGKRRDTETFQFNAFGAVPLMAEPRDVQGGVEDDHEEEVIA